jgi:hypothetical protein
MSLLPGLMARYPYPTRGTACSSHAFFWTHLTLFIPLHKNVPFFLEYFSQTSEILLFFMGRLECQLFGAPHLSAPLHSSFWCPR